MHITQWQSNHMDKVESNCDLANKIKIANLTSFLRKILRLIILIIFCITMADNTENTEYKEWIFGF